MFHSALVRQNPYQSGRREQTATRDDFADHIQRAIDAKTKPAGALGHIETLAFQIAKLQATLTPRMASCCLTIFAADHGLAAEGISAFPQAVTWQMVLNFLAGGTAANVFARTLDVAVQVVDTGCVGTPIRDD